MRLTKISSIFGLVLGFFVILIVFIGFRDINVDQVFSLFRDGEFLSAVLFGLKTSILAVLFSAVLGIPTGFLLARNSSFISKSLDVLFDIPLIVPPLVVGVLLLNLFNSPFIKVIYNFVFSFWAAAVAQFFIAFPFTVKSSKTSFGLVDPIYERIAMTLGAGAFRSFFDTTLKLSLSGIVSGLILSWLRSLGEFGATLIVAGGIAYKTENVPINIYLKISEGDFNGALAESLLIITLAFFSVFIIKVIVKYKRRF